MVAQLAELLGGGQGLPGHVTGGLGHPQGQKAIARLPRRLHGVQHAPVIQHQAAAGQLFIHRLAPLVVVHGPAALDHCLVGGEIEHTGACHGHIVKVFSLSLQGKEIQQRLQP